MTAKKLKQLAVATPPLMSRAFWPRVAKRGEWGEREERGERGEWGVPR